MKTFTLEEAREFVRKCGAEPLFEKYTNSCTKYLIRCSCGKEEEILFSTLGRNLSKNSGYIFKCSKCRNVGRPIYTTEKIKEDFKRYRAEPLFEEYKSLKQKLSYRCECGGVDSTTCSQFYKHIKEYENYRLLCQSCSCKEARKDKVNGFFKGVVIPYFKERGIKLLSKSYENNHTLLNFICGCGKEGQVTWISLKNNNCLKCRECQLNDRPRGENHPDWNPLLSKEDRLKTRYGRGNLEKIWESFVLKLSNYTCVVSGQRGGYLSAHHLNAWAKNPEERYRLNNGVCISRECHKEFHDRYGMKRGNNTIDQFKEFYREKTGEEFKENNVIVDFIEETPYPNYLLKKKREFGTEGKLYIHFFVPEIMLKQDIVLSMIKYRYGIIRDKIYARKLKIEEIKDFSRVRKFLDENHIQGYTTSSINLALMEGEQIVSLMTFTKSKIENEYILQRFCSKINTVVVGGASKLFKYFIKEYNPDKVVTYGDVRFVDTHLINSMYIILGFHYSHTSKPNYWYTKDGEGLQFRRKFQRHRLDKIFNKEFDKDMSERDIMLAEGYQRLYDCGNDVFIYKKNWSFFV